MKYYYATALVRNSNDEVKIVYKEILADSEYDVEVQAKKWADSLKNVIPDSWEVDDL
jgi:hypothetical protein